VSTMPTVTEHDVTAWRQAAWSGSPATRFATTIILVGETLCEAADLRATQRILDLATGTGNTALSAARRNCRAVGLDYVPSYLREGRARAAVEALSVQFLAGDGERLPFGDATFDAVLSSFGVMFVPNQEQAAQEIVRVLRPGGTVGLASHTPESLAARFSLITARRVRPPRRIRSPFLWGTPERLHELFGERMETVSAAERSVTVRFPTCAAVVDFFATNFGPMHAAFAALDEPHQQALREELIDAVEGVNRSGDDTAVIPFVYLEAILVRR
jgi:SAM-dependent methyltransferase